VGVSRRRLLSERVRLERNLLARRPGSASPAKVLCYHSVGQPEYGLNDVTPAQFRRHLDIVVDQGFQFVTASAIAAGSAPPGSIALTFDDALRSVHDVAAPLLLERQIPFSVFVVSSWCDQLEAWQRQQVMPWSAVSALVEVGCDVGSHSATHPRFSALAGSAVLEELMVSRRTITDNTGVEATSFAIPFGQSGDWSVQAGVDARQAGYQVVYAQSELLRPLCTVGRTFISRHDTDRVFRAALGGAFDAWEEPT